MQIKGFEKYTNNFFQNLMKPLELYPKAGSFWSSERVKIKSKSLKLYNILK